MSNGVPYVMRKMRYEDIPQVVAIDRKSFPIPWTTNVYRYEIGQNALSSMVVLAMPAPSPADPDDESSVLASLLDRLFGRTVSEPDTIVSYGGFWFNRGQAHISTIASHPDYRGRGFGEALLAGMIRQALQINAQVISLEVRVSNVPAIALYRKYAFMRFGVKDRYYRDNGEDAYDMRISPVDDRYRERFETLWTALRARIPFLDQYTENEHTRSLF